MLKKSKKILLIDDDQRFMDMFAHYLERDSEFAVEKLMPQNGVDVAKQAALYNPDLILLDILMPERSGDEIINDFQNEDEHLLRVMFLTGIVSAEQADYKVMEIGPCKYLSKGIPHDKLIELIKQEMNS